MIQGLFDQCFQKLFFVLENKKTHTFGKQDSDCYHYFPCFQSDSFQRITKRYSPYFFILFIEQKKHHTLCFQSFVLTCDLSSNMSPPLALSQGEFYLHQHISSFHYFEIFEVVFARSGSLLLYFCSQHADSFSFPRFPSLSLFWFSCQTNSFLSLID